MQLKHSQRYLLQYGSDVRLFFKEIYLF